jgi:AraC-like DNA-binding protein
MTTYREYLPSSALRPFVECYWTAYGQQGEKYLVLPDGCADFVFEDTGGRQAAEIVGTMTRALPIREAAPTFRLGVRFRPGGAAPLVRAPLHDVHNRVVDLADVLPSSEELLEAVFAGNADPRSRVRRIDELLSRRVGRDPDRGVSLAVQRIRRSGGRLAISALCESLGWTRQHLARRFQREIGVSPKALSRIFRLQSVLDRVSAGEALDWSGFALDAGYCDQSHFVGEFREIMGLTPSAYVASR